MKYHILAFVAGFILDLFFGDPYWMPHPIRAIGNLIAWLERALIGAKSEEGSIKLKSLSKKEQRLRGCLLVLFVIVIVEVPVILLLLLCYHISPWLSMGVEAVMTYQLLACKCLKVESMKVYDKLQHGSLEEARFAVSMIVGRDTAKLSREEVTRAAVETVAENTSDGIIAPMLFLAIGGPVLGFFYKCINTMDSMVGYKNDRYQYFGTCAAKLDDIVNYVPARISAWFMILSCLFLGRDYSLSDAKRIYLRDRYNHASPNSAQTESACAGALGLRLAGPTSYFGVLHEKPYIGDAKRDIQVEDIKRANKLLYATALICHLLCILLMIIFL